MSRAVSAGVAFSQGARGAGRVAFRFRPPRLAFGLHGLETRMQVPGIDRRLHQHVLYGGELLTQLGILGGEDEEE